MKRVLFLWLLVCLLPVAVRAEQKETAEPQKKHSVTLKWDAPVTRAGGKVVGYKVYRSDKENGHYRLIAQKVRALTYVDTTVQSGHTYYYRVSSMDAKERESTPATIKATVP